MDSQKITALVRLKLLGSLEAGDKLSTRYLAIQKNTFTTMLTRYLYSESRLNTIVFVRNTVAQALDMLKQTVPPLDAETKLNLQMDLKRAVKGLGNLRETYVGCLRTVCELTQIIESIQHDVK